ncbi:thiamine phosphate synthase, partial [Oleiphilus sp. HI0125]
ARIIQYRNKIASVDQQLKEARFIKSLTQEFDALLFINDSIELCLAANADGVHLGQNDDKISSAKQQLG